MVHMRAQVQGDAVPPQLEALAQVGAPPLPAACCRRPHERCAAALKMPCLCIWAVV